MHIEHLSYNNQRKAKQTNIEGAYISLSSFLLINEANTMYLYMYPVVEEGTCGSTCPN